MRRLAVFLLVAVATGCATRKPVEQIVPFNEEQTRTLLRNARPPQTFGLTVYSSERGPIFGGAHRLRGGPAALVPFANPRDSRVPVILMGSRRAKAIPALIDTASRENWILPLPAAQFSAVPLAGPRPYATQPVHVYDEIAGYAFVIPDVQLEQIQVDNAVFYVRAAQGPLGAAARWISDPEPVAVLGAPFLRAFSYVSLDFPNRVAVFSTTLAFPGASEDDLLAVVDLQDVRGVIGVKGSIDGEPTTFIIDTGGNFDVVVNEPEKTPIKRLAVGDLVFPPNIRIDKALDVGLGEIEVPRIGRGLLSRYRVTFDFRGRKVWIERPSPASP